MILTATLLALCNMLRGEAKISHMEWVLVSWIIVGEPIAWLLVLACTMPRTRYFLDAINNDLNGLWKGMLRNTPVLLLAWASGHWIYALMMLQPFVYYVCGRAYYPKATRIAEALSGLMLGAMI